MTVLLILLILGGSPKETNPVKIVFTTTIKLYQKIVSPAQGDVCNFSPSCSHFASNAFEKYGIFWGTLMSADRLMRCNPSAIDYYDTFYSGIKDNKVYDPVENNYLPKQINKPFELYIEPIK
uniref:Membrane protein insertion efficiency factor YidD n=1 Tax=candidate division WOR-3 bacterium TaxID=2052148 RepID=A0A7V0Z444_UNCW3